MKNISVIGAGTMGLGIGHVFAMYDYKVCLCDVSEPILTSGLKIIENNLLRMANKGKIKLPQVASSMGNIRVTTDLNSSVQNADLVIEAASENIDIKNSIFKVIDTYAPKHAILASNTSSISITKIANATLRPEKVIGMHFMNPVPIMKLVELIKGYKTHADTVAKVISCSEEIGKIPVMVNDYPGFISNRILLPMINEAIYALYESVAGVAEIDRIMKLGMAHPMGPLQLADFIGLDVCLSILNVLYDGFGNPKYAPCPLLVNMVAAGNLGRKTSEGFYQYLPGSKEMIVSSQFEVI